ncbi:DUF6044 family protein [Litchfieldia alkalitelluris]|uniref:DUF6044 family protein n=1 Tax=Litchfieldia alkalitelluris TaxID=304268 RepID=UPI0038B2B985
MKAVNIQSSKETKQILFALVLIFIYVSPLFILGEDAHIRDHDNLDSNIAWYRVLVESGEVFGKLNATIPQVINGNLSRGAYGSELSVIVWLHALFPPMLAYALSQTLTRVIAFIGMYLLLKTHFIKEKNNHFMIVGVSLAFALTPFWPSGMLSTLGHPLALWAFLNIRNRKHSWREWLALGLLPFYSSLVLGFIFFLVMIGLLWVRDVIVRRDWNPVFLGSIFFMTLIFCIVDYRLIFSLIVPHEATQRSEFISSRHDVWRSLRLSIKNYVLGHHHVMTVHTFNILPLTLVATGVILKRKNWREHRRFIYLFLFNIALSIWYAFWFNNLWKPVKEIFNIAVTFNFARFHFLRPLVIYLLFALSCLILSRLGRRWRRFVSFMIIGQISILFLFNEEIVFRYLGTPSFKEYYAEEQFNKIKDYIDLPQKSYRVASIGLHPAIAQFNGFYTVDTYNNFYPLSYKYQFRRIIEKELEKNPNIRVYFDEWGSRCYLFVDELGKKYDFRKNSDKVINHLELNTKAFENMGGRYIFSSVPINNAGKNNLLLKRVFDHQDSAWRIYLYEVDGS